MTHRSEYEEQVAVFQWAEFNLHRLPELELLKGSLVGVNLNIVQASRAKAAGVKKDYPDIFLPVARGGFHGLFIELKRRDRRDRKGKLRKEYPTKGQHKILYALNDQGYLAIWGRGSDFAIAQIELYLK